MKKLTESSINVTSVASNFTAGLQDGVGRRLNRCSRWFQFWENSVCRYAAVHEAVQSIDHRLLLFSKNIIINLDITIKYLYAWPSVTVSEMISNSALIQNEENLDNKRRKILLILQRVWYGSSRNDIVWRSQQKSMNICPGPELSSAHQIMRNVEVKLSLRNAQKTKSCFSEPTATLKISEFSSVFGALFDFRWLSNFFYGWYDDVQGI